MNDYQHRLMHLVSQGLSNEQIAGVVNYSPHTVKQHLSTCYRILGVPPTGNRTTRLRGVVAYMGRS